MPGRVTLLKPAGRAGRLVALADLPFTFERTLMPRATSDQAIITGLSFSINTAIAELVQESVQALSWVAAGRADRSTRHRTTLGLDAVAMVAGLATQALVPLSHREPLTRAGVRTGGYWLAQSGAAGAVSVGLVEIAQAKRAGRSRWFPAAVAAAGAAVMGVEVARRLKGQGAASVAAGASDAVEAVNATVDVPGPEDQRLKALGMGLGTAAALTGVGIVEHKVADAVGAAVARVLPGHEAMWRPVGHLATLAALGYGAKTMVERTLGKIEHGETGFEAAFDIPPPNPLLSGSHESLVDFSTLSRQGRRFVWTVTTREQIEAVLGEPAREEPIRAYVGLASAGGDDEARVKLLIDELDRTGAFDRGWLMIMCPTGSGYLNYAASGAFEVLTRGDCATCSIQYSARPSVLSLDRVRYGRRAYRAFFAALGERLARIPEGERPKVVLFGESLGSWASQDAFKDRGTNGLEETGIDYAIWIGTPYFSKWKERVLFDARADVDPSTIAVVSGIGEWEALAPAARERARYVMVTHHNDGVALFGPPLAIQEPSWLADREQRAVEVPAGMTWMPTTTFLQVLVDMKNSTNVTAGTFDDTGHDYRGSLVPMFDAVLRIGAAAGQLDALQQFLEDRELQRTRWIDEHGGLGESMAARVVEVLYREARERGEDPDARLQEVVARIAAEDFAAAGGAGARDAQA
ncbi:MAG: hypothetical protein FJW95_11820 [Actinobacteria bacterium]|nr:hypothetical protein [Actinomycetota bacterium]